MSNLFGGGGAKKAQREARAERERLEREAKAEKAELGRARRTSRGGGGLGRAFLGARTGSVQLGFRG